MSSAPNAVLVAISALSLGVLCGSGSSPAAAGAFAPRTGPVAKRGVASGRSTAPGRRATAQVERFLGFEIGEQRRYVLGPPEALGADERGIWAITLDEIYRTGGGEPEAVFLLGHEWHAPQLIEVPLRMITDVKSEGSVRVNGHGFPLLVAYQTERHLAGLGGEAYTIDYRWEEDRYRKLTSIEGGQREGQVVVRGADTLDLRVPAGLFAFLPEAPGCLDRRVLTYDGLSQVTPPPPRTASTPASPMPAPPSTTRVVDNEDCEESLFANPGLLSLAMPALWEAKGRRELLFFTPLGPTGERSSQLTVGMPGAGTGTPGQGPRPPGRGGVRPEPRMLDYTPITPTSYRDLEELEAGERVRIRVGARMRDAWMLTGAEHLGAIYVDDDGVVLRVDLPRPRADAPQRWIRLLWPSEF